MMGLVVVVFVVVVGVGVVVVEVEASFSSSEALQHGSREPRWSSISNFNSFRLFSDVYKDSQSKIPFCFPVVWMN